MPKGEISLKNVQVHNLKGVDLKISHGSFVVFTGVSGSGKTSLAFDTIYMEGQRRYVESLSSSARRHLSDMPKPKADAITGISPTIAIEQKTAGKNPRSTVGTMTGIHDYLRVLYARVGKPFCPISAEPLTPQTVHHIIDTLEKIEEGRQIFLFAPYVSEKKGACQEELDQLLQKGFARARVDGEIIEISDSIFLDKTLSHNIDVLVDRIKIQKKEQPRLIESVTEALKIGSGLMSVFFPDTNEEKLFSETAYSPKSGISYPLLDPKDFSFNHPSGMCPTCSGLGVSQEFDLNKIIDPDKSIAEDCCLIASSFTTIRYGNIYRNLGRIGKFDIHTPWKKLSLKAQQLFLEGTGEKWTSMTFTHPETKKKWTEYVSWKGVLHEAFEKFEKAESESYKNKFRALMHEGICPSCNGARIKPYPAATRIGSLKIQELCALPLSSAAEFFENLKLQGIEEKIGKELLIEIRERLHFLLNVGLHYLTLDRKAPTLSGGEAQRVRLASQIGSGLVGVTYVLDEPSIGLHPRDNKKLLQTLKALQEKGNTLLVIEHDEETILAADQIVDVGPGAGSRGGKVLSAGTLEELLCCKESETANYLTFRKEITIPKKRRKKKKETLKLYGVCHHNLKNVNLEIPLGLFIAVTGVSGSGKSSLISDVLEPYLSNKLHGGEKKVGSMKKMEGIEHIDKVIGIDQSPIGRTPRSNPATYCKVFDPIRDLFASLPESSAKGFDAGRFSFNVQEGNCPHCSGMGMVKVDMDFMEEEWVLCEQCEGRRFEEETLRIRYKTKSIYDVLEMTIEEAGLFFENIPSIRKILDTLIQVGLGYIKLGQPSPTLSGGEAQRIKLAKELARPSTGKTLFILDEPTTGLHFADIDKLCSLLHALVEKGNTILVIEHNMDLVKTADHIIDLGPEGGIYGGEIVGSGTPEEIAENKTPTGIAVKEALERKPIKAVKKEKKQESEAPRFIDVVAAEQNTLKKVSAQIPHGSITICTGPSGSGKSSFAFDTIYAEGQRRYTESMSPYARQFIKQMEKPKIEKIDGLLPAIAIEQRVHAGNPRSTVGTMTEIYDFLRVLFASLGTAHCPRTGEIIQTISKERVADALLKEKEGTKMVVLAPLKMEKAESFEQMKERLYKEGFARLRLNGEIFSLEEDIIYEKTKKNSLELVIDRLTVSPTSRARLLEAIELAAKRNNGTFLVDVANEKRARYYNLSFALASTGESFPPITPHSFSFNTESGMCPNCQGIGLQYGAQVESVKKIDALTPSALIQLLWKKSGTVFMLPLFRAWMREENIAPYVKIGLLTDSQKHALFYGSEKRIRLESHFYLKWLGINELIARAAKMGSPALKESVKPLTNESVCPTCEGSRLKELSRFVEIKGVTLPMFTSMPIESALSFINKLTLSKEKQFLEETLFQIKKRLTFLSEIGLHYLSLNRSAPTLSGGESQRIQLAKGLGGGLTGCLYVLDEPTIGLHPSDNEKLKKSLTKLKDLGNTLILVEHDKETLKIADYILDFGPKAGILGGEIVARGTYTEIKKNKNSLTGDYLSGRKCIEPRFQRRKGKGFLKIENASLHNLKNLSLSLPLGAFSCITGVSGSGKSSLVKGLINPAVTALSLRPKKGAERKKSIVLHGCEISLSEPFDRVISLDQDPIGHTNRANVSTYTDLLTHLRALFASTPDAKRRGLMPYSFSFNHLKGMCKSCFGLGTKSIEMQFLPPVKVLCESCNGFQLNPLSLEIKYKGKHLGDVFALSVVEALPFFEAIPGIKRILETLERVGLGYLTLGQPMNTLSGGEQQRIRLCRELSKRKVGKTLYLFDEPTVGLHTDDVAKLLPIFQELVDLGGTLIVIEHNMELIAHADYVVDLGPEAGDAGGEIVSQGTPEEICKEARSKTAKHLKESLPVPSK